MTNLEKYMEEILNRVLPSCSVYEIRKNKKRNSCNNDCRNCQKENLKWLAQEYKEPIKLTQYEYDTLLYIKSNGYEWIARDNKNAYAYAYADKPAKESRYNWVGEDWMKLFPKMFSFVKWEDDEPCNIQELLDNCEVFN